MTLVSGHQRLAVLDQLHKGKNYNLTVSMTELDEKTEVEANVFMNNKSVQGEFDYDMLGQLHELFPDISFTDDLGFNPAEVSLMFSGLDDDIAIMMGDNEEAVQIKDEAKKFTEGDFKTNRKKELQKIKEQANQSGSVQLEKDDFMFSVVCISNDEKQRLMKLMHEQPNERFIKSNKLYDIYDHKIKLRELT